MYYIIRTEQSIPKEVKVYNTKKVAVSKFKNFVTKYKNKDEFFEFKGEYVFWYTTKDGEQGCVAIFDNKTNKTLEKDTK